MHAVQPGFDREAVLADSEEDALRLLLVALYDDLRQDGVDFHVLGGAGGAHAPA